MSDPPPAERVDRRVWIIALTCACGPLMSGIDATMVNIALTTIGRSYGVPLGTIQWVSSAYLLALALALPLNGWLVDRVGARRVFLGCFAVFIAGSALCGLARSAPELIAFRVLQGIAGGLLAPMMQLMMARHAGRHMARVIGIAAMPVMVGQMAGPSLGGLILTWLDWHWIFLVNVPVGLVAIAFAWRVLPRDETTTPRRLDLLGLAMISPGLALLMESLVALSQQGSSAPWTLALGLALLAGFAVHASRRPAAALIDLRLFRGRVFRAAAATQFLSNAINFGGQVMMPLFFLNLRELPANLTGLMLAPMGLGVFCALPIMGRLSERLGARLTSGAGALIALIGTLPFAVAGPEAPLWLLATALFVRGFGQGSITLPSAAAAYASVPRDSLTSATTAINICQRIGGPVGTTGLAIFLQSMLTRTATPESAYMASMWLLAALAGLGMLAASRLPGPRRPEDNG
jgi:EmrB/QacA subfamily drug resistance transporter